MKAILRLAGRFLGLIFAVFIALCLFGIVIAFINYQMNVIGYMALEQLTRQETKYYPSR